MDILVGTDLSERARDALKWSIELKKHREQNLSEKTHVRVLYVVEPDYQITSKDALIDAIREEIETVGGNADECNIDIERGNPRESLRKAALENNADLLAVSLTGRGRFERVIPGSTALGLSHNPPSPMVLCHHESKRYSELNSMCVGVDFSESSDRAVELAYNVARARDIELHFVHVTKPDPYAPGTVITQASEATDVFNQDVEEARSELERNIKKNLGGEALEDSTLEILQGYPSKSLIDYARQKNCDVIAASAKGRSAMGDFFAGSVAHGIIRQAPCHILLAPAVQ